MFDATSRYHDIATTTLTVTDPDGRPRIVSYKRRRIIPHLDAAETLLEHTVIDGERLDNITARYLGDPTQFWRLCDANTVLRPEDLEVAGRVIRILTPEPRR